MRRLKIRFRLLISFTLLSLLCTGIATLSIYTEVRPRLLEAVEYTLIDMSHFLAAELAADAEADPSHSLASDRLRKAMTLLMQTRFPERKSLHCLNENALRIYITDANGKVLFDSNDGRDEAQDYSQWRDVHLSLQGKYGARATRVVADDPNTSIHFIAAPIRLDGKIIGVVSVGKPVQSLAGFFRESRFKIFLIFCASSLVALFMSGFAAYWSSRPVLRLEAYVKSAATAHPLPYPRLPEDEVGDLGQAFERLRKELEGRDYVERYVHNLTHEIKTPLTAILGAAELLNTQGLSTEETAQLARNVQSETLRLQDLTVRLLELASLEARDRQLKLEVFDLGGMLSEVLESFTVLAQKHSLVLDLNLAIQMIESNSIQRIESSAIPRIDANAERFLIWRAVSNLVQNAIDFSETPGKITVSAMLRENQIEIEVRNQGHPIPGYAIERAGEKFFSLERPRTEKKSSGLGLNFVIEVMKLHSGQFSLSQTEDNQTRAICTWPA